MSSTATAESRVHPSSHSRRAHVEQVMGLPISIHVRADGPAVLGGHELMTAVEQAFAVLRKVDAVFSTWRADSDVMRVRRGDLDPAGAHPWLAEVQQLCADAEVRTAGLFSASYGSASESSASAGSAVPDAAPYDPTGLVKGWAVERAARHLQHATGISWCINAGGDLLAGSGRGAAASTWQVGIEDPRQPGMVAATVALRSGGLATSGAAARGAHVIDPRTGVAIARAGSATVWGPTLRWADVWATALFVDPLVGERMLGRVDPAYRSLLL